MVGAERGSTRDAAGFSKGGSYEAVKHCRKNVQPAAAAAAVAQDATVEIRPEALEAPLAFVDPLGAALLRDRALTAALSLFSKGKKSKAVRTHDFSKSVATSDRAKQQQDAPRGQGQQLGDPLQRRPQPPILPLTVPSFPVLLKSARAAVEEAEQHASPEAAAQWGAAAPRVARTSSPMHRRDGEAVGGPQHCLSGKTRPQVATCSVAALNMAEPPEPVCARLPGDRTKSRVMELVEGCTGLPRTAMLALLDNSSAAANKNKGTRLNTANRLQDNPAVHQVTHRPELSPNPNSHLDDTDPVERQVSGRTSLKNRGGARAASAGRPADPRFHDVLSGTVGDAYDRQDNDSYDQRGEFNSERQLERRAVLHQRLDLATLDQDCKGESTGFLPRRDQEQRPALHQHLGLASLERHCLSGPPASPGFSGSSKRRKLHGGLFAQVANEEAPMDTLWVDDALLDKPSNLLKNNMLRHADRDNSTSAERHLDDLLSKGLRHKVSFQAQHMHANSLLPAPLSDYDQQPRPEDSFCTGAHGYDSSAASSEVEDGEKFQTELAEDTAFTPPHHPLQLSSLASCQALHHPPLQLHAFSSHVLTCGTTLPESTNLLDYLQQQQQQKQQQRGASDSAQAGPSGTESTSGGSGGSGV